MSTTVIAYVGLLTVTLAALNVGYRLFGSKLARAGVPGPWQAKVTSVYAQYYISRGMLHTFLKQLHDQYGPIVQFTPNQVSVITKNSADRIYNTYTFKKSAFYRSFDYGGDNIFSVDERNVHSARKKVIRNIFAAQNIEKLEPMANEVAIQPFVEKLATLKTIDIYAMFHFIMFDITGQLSFSRDFGLVRTGEHPVVQWLKEAQVYGILMYQFPAIKLVGGLFGKHSYNGLIDFCQDLIDERRRGAPKKDILQAFLDARDEEGKPICDEDIGAEMVTQVIAGTDTTANTLTWTLKLLLDHPDEMKKVVEELDLAFPDPNTINADAVKEKCKYLDAVINESMRLFPIAAGYLPRVVPEGGADFEGYYLPAGAECGIATFAYHRSSNIWDDPDAFIPSRFLGKDGVKVRSNFLPFLAGPRACIGREMAWMAMYIILANLLRRFNVAWHDKNLPVTHCYFLVLKPIESRMLIDVASRA
ncbi:hypothetical protein L0F63_000674 [Massospora cicadina]|nr:hypothetical protein L0F63_000674 [Massospora cicadina]